MRQNFRFDASNFSFETKWTLIDNEVLVSQTTDRPILSLAWRQKVMQIFQKFLQININCTEQKKSLAILHFYFDWQRDNV